jgi:alpha-L-fucosidase
MASLPNRREGGVDTTLTQHGSWTRKWGPQCEPERGDWYAREMYLEGSPRYRYHVARYGHPSNAGFKEVIREWKAERWDPTRWYRSICG